MAVNDQNDSSPTDNPVPLSMPLLHFVLIAAVPTLLILLSSLYLSARLRERAWNSASKRFTRQLEICFVSLYFVSFSYWSCCNAVGMGLLFLIVLFLCTNFYMTSAATALLLQTIFPWLSERRQVMFRSKTAKSCMVVLEIMALLMMLFYNGSSFHYVEFIHYDDLLFWVISTLFIMFICFILQVFNTICVLVLVCLALQKKIQILRLKFFILVTTIVFDCLFSFCILFAGFLYDTGLFPVLGANILCLLVFLVLMHAVTYSRDVWCFCCRFHVIPQVPNSRTPLLNDHHQRERANNRNTSSLTTRSHHPLEMSDCYEQLS